MTIPRYTNSQLTNASICPALAYFTKILHLKPTRLNINLEYGSAIHLGFETYFKSIKNGICKSSSETAAIEAFIDYFSPLDLPHNNQKNLQTGEMALKGYIFQCEIEPENIIDVEMVVDRPLSYKGDRYIYGGKIDLLLKDKHGHVIVVDHKTVGSGRYTSYTYDKWTLSRQLIGYAWINTSNRINVNVVYCLKEPEIYILEFAFGPGKFQRWVINTMGLIKELDDRIKQYRYWEKHKEKGIKGLVIPEMLFPRIGSQCLSQFYGCPFETLCHQDKNIEEIVISEVDFEEMTEEEKGL